ncbi:ATP synthase F0 subunit A [Puteibacter caeruleilacunae]|nr:ATP synthase F0 subunit A [Puteibacter caeruleilacunae]
MNRITTILVIGILLTTTPLFTYASSDDNSTASGFNAGEFVMHHISDSYDWHIMSIGEKHISIPLPIIVYSKTKGLNCFLSSRFDHGHSSFNGFKIEENGTNKGKIVEVIGNTMNTDNTAELPWDLSITKTVAGIMVSVVLMLMIFISAGKAAQRNKGKAPTGIQNFVEPVILFLRDDVAKPAIGEDKYQRYMPYLLTIFFFILINNLLGLIPIFPFGANVTGNISVTLALALFTFIVTTVSGNKHYWKEIINPDVPTLLKIPIPLMPLIEFIGMLIKPVVLMIRLFANMMAGHMIISIFVALIFIFANLFGPTVAYSVAPFSILFGVFMTLLDVLVSFIQAYVFVFLSAIYIGMATSEHH